MKFFILLLGSVGLYCQEVASRVVHLKHISPENTIAVMDTFSNGRVRWKTDQALGIVVMSGPAEVVEAMEAAIKKLDVPPQTERNVELTFHLLLASPAGEGGAILPDLAAVAQQLRSVFSLKSIRVLETVVVRSRENRGMESKGIMAPPSKADATAYYSMRVGNVRIVPGEGAPRIRLNQLGFNAKLPWMNSSGGLNYNEVEIKTDIDMKEGQKVVVGKSTVDAGSQSIFLVVNGKVID